MTDPPRFRYFLSDNAHPVLPGSALWSDPLPMHPATPTAGAGAWRYGDYFEALTTFLLADGLPAVSAVLSGRAGRPIAVRDLADLRIYLEKHGQFYHPARVEIAPGDGAFVINAALSAAGQNIIDAEYRLLQRLGQQFASPYLPRVFARGRVRSGGARQIHLFLGEWFEEYHEFHLTWDPARRRRRIRVWHPQHTGLFLSRRQTLDLYTRAAWILTSFYDIETLAQIYPWHHAAGDFVVRRIEDRIDLKLITVRRYRSPLDDQEVRTEDRDPAWLMQGLLIFLVNLSIRMRLDRLDGVGRMVWAAAEAVEGTLCGFLAALQTKTRPACLPAPPADCFRVYLLTLGRQVWTDTARDILAACDPRSPERPVIEAHLRQHVADLYDGVRALLGRCGGHPSGGPSDGPGDEGE